MIATGSLSRSPDGWKVRDLASGKVYRLSGVDFPERVVGLTVKVVGEVEDSFGAGLGTDDPVIAVQRWTTA